MPSETTTYDFRQIRFVVAPPEPPAPACVPTRSHVVDPTIKKRLEDAKREKERQAALEMARQAEIEKRQKLIEATKRTKERAELQGGWGHRPTARFDRESGLYVFD